MGNQMALLGVIPEPANIGDQLAAVIDECVINRDDTVLGVARAGVALQQVEPSLVERVWVPVDLGDPAIQAGLIGRDRKFAIDAADGFAFGDE